jgi:hypothetical protein
VRGLRLRIHSPRRILTNRVKMIPVNRTKTIPARMTLEFSLKYGCGREEIGRDEYEYV